MSQAGISIETIADQLGHDGTRMTLLIYRHTTKPTISAGNAKTQHTSPNDAPHSRIETKDRPDASRKTRMIQYYAFENCQAHIDDAPM